MRHPHLPPTSAAANVGGIVIPAPTSLPSERVGTLYVVSLPIGDPDDITLRALRVLGDVSLIVAENATITRRFLHRCHITTETVSLRPRRGGPAQAAALLRLSEGRGVAVVVDSGTPTLVDPGLTLIQSALKHGHRVTAVPGASACLAALVISGMPTSPCLFLGRPPRHDPERSAFFAPLARIQSTVILYESPRYLRSTLTEIAQCLENTGKIVVACDLTHTTERIFRGTISAAVSAFAGNNAPGVYTIVVAGKPSSAYS